MLESQESTRWMEPHHCGGGDGDDVHGWACGREHVQAQSA